MPPKRFSVDEYVSGVRSGSRMMLGRAITLIESQLITDRPLAQAVLQELLPHTGASIRVGITGVPGVGKSTFIEAFGLHAVELGHRVAVLSIDPSSQRTGGSILGDKTRMEELAHHPQAFIRPSPSGQALGGVAAKTRETMLLCEAAGFDVVVVETVGVGQSETVVKGMVDFFLLLLLAGAGDELQGIKRGIMEMADAIAINKADGDNYQKARLAQADFRNALHLFPPTESGWIPPVAICSALEHKGIDELWKLIALYKSDTTANGFWQKNRNAQQLEWMHTHIREQLIADFYESPELRQRLALLEAQVTSGHLLPVQAAEQALNMVAIRSDDRY